MTRDAIISRQCRCDGFMGMIGLSAGLIPMWAAWAMRGKSGERSSCMAECLQQDSAQQEKGGYMKPAKRERRRT